MPDATKLRGLISDIEEGIWHIESLSSGLHAIIQCSPNQLSNKVVAEINCCIAEEICKLRRLHTETEHELEVR